MAEHQEARSKNSQDLSQFDPKARKEITDSELKAIEKTRSADFYFLKGEKYRIRGKSKQAISCYKKVLHMDREHQDAIFFMGFCYLPKTAKATDHNLKPNKTARAKEAMLAFERLIALRERENSICWDDYVVYHNLGVAQCHLRLYEKAIESFRRAMELNPSHADSYYMLGRAQLALNSLEDAIESFKHAVEIRPGFADAHYNLGVSQSMLGRYKEAIWIKRDRR